MPARIIIVDDDTLLTDSLGFLLKQEGYDVTVAGTAAEALRLMGRWSPDLVLLDVGLPDLSGVEVCRRLRSDWPGPIIMLTARRQDADKVIGLDSGADDYVTKPFVSTELLARVRAALRRAQQSGRGGSPLGTIDLVDLQIDRDARAVTVRDAPIYLSAREFDLLLLLAERPGHVVTRRFLIDTIWGPDFYGDERALDVYIHALRKKIEPDPERPQYLQTVRGVGYRLDTSIDE
ncbi:MAG TPA: response regulator transcription factor [Chloroflexota bacterium]|jgi:DNA-binding response OmpR family regulator|nr:response regulator transcription factor [Chloroflexota bacterium]